MTFFTKMFVKYISTFSSKAPTSCLVLFPQGHETIPGMQFLANKDSGLICTADSVVVFSEALLRAYSVLEFGVLILKVCTGCVGDLWATELANVILRGFPCLCYESLQFRHTLHRCLILALKCSKLLK